MKTGFNIEARDRFIHYPITLSGSFEGRKQAADYIDILIRALVDAGSTSDREIDGSVTIDSLIYLRVVPTDSAHWTRDLQDGLTSLIEDDLVAIHKFIDEAAEREANYLECLDQAFIDDLACVV